MTLEELIKELGIDGDKADTLKKEYNALLKEKNTTEGEKAKLEKEKEKLAEKLERLKDDAEKLEIVVKAFDLDKEAEDFDKMLDDTKDKLAGEKNKADKDVKELTRELTKMNRENGRLKGEVEKLTTDLNAEKETRIKSYKESEILKELQANNVIKADQWVGKFILESKLDDDGKAIFMTDEAGKEITLKDGIMEWAKNNPEFVKAEVKGGAGSNGGNGGSRDGDEISDFMKSIINESSPDKEGKSLGEMFG